MSPVSAVQVVKATLAPATSVGPLVDAKPVLMTQIAKVTRHVQMTEAAWISPVKSPLALVMEQPVKEGEVLPVPDAGSLPAPAPDFKTNMPKVSTAAVHPSFANCVFTQPNQAASESTVSPRTLPLPATPVIDEVDLVNEGIENVENGDFHSALAVCNQAWSIHETKYTINSEEGTRLLQTRGAAKVGLGDYVSALADCKQALEVHESVGTLETEAAARVQHTIGLVKAAVGDSLGALPHCECALQLHERLNTVDSDEGARVLNSIGVAKVGLGDHTGAITHFLRAVDIRERIGMVETEDGARLFRHLAVAQGNVGDMSGALENCRRALEVRQWLGTVCSEEGARVLNGLSVALVGAGDNAHALDTCLQALLIREQLGTVETLEGGRVLRHIGIIKEYLGDKAEEALPHYSRALEVYNALGMQNTSEVCVLREAYVCLSTRSPCVRS